jgi:hypothetical protein
MGVAMPAVAELGQQRAHIIEVRSASLVFITHLLIRGIDYVYNSFFQCLGDWYCSNKV